MHNLIRTVTSDSPEQTEAIGAQIGAKLRGGETIELISDLGGGKTTLVHGLASGLGSSDAVASPSFTISRQYQAGKLTMYHFDFYRLTEPGIMANELAEILPDPQAIIVIEWGTIVENVLPGERLTIRLESPAESERKITLSCPAKLSYLLPKEG
jgi:tRNA threonylcarbamoyladenosine biosynthesis protein TsaE